MAEGKGQQGCWVWPRRGANLAAAFLLSLCMCACRRLAGWVAGCVCQSLGVMQLSRKDLGKLVDRMVVDPASPAAITSSSSSPPPFHYLLVLKARLLRLLADPAYLH